MIYSQATVENGKVKILNTKEIDQSKLTADCWLVQFNGLQACTTCEYQGTDDCGGGKTLQALKNK